MAVLGKNIEILIDQWRFSGQSNTAQVEISTPELDATVFQANGMIYEPGLRTAKIQHGGYFTGKGAGYLEQEMVARLGTATPVIFGLSVDTTALANPLYASAQTWAKQLSIDAPIAELIKLTGQWPDALENFDRGLRIFDGQVAATGNQTAYDVGAAGSAGGRAYLWVTGINGTAVNASIKVQSATTQGGTYSDECTFTVSAVGGFVQPLSGNVDRWLRVNVASMGGATGLTFVCATAINGVTQ